MVFKRSVIASVLILTICTASAMQVKFRDDATEETKKKFYESVWNEAHNTFLDYVHPDVKTYMQKFPDSAKATQLKQFQTEYARKALHTVMRYNLVSSSRPTYLRDNDQFLKLKNDMRAELGMPLLSAKEEFCWERDGVQTDYIEKVKESLEPEIQSFVYQNHSEDEKSILYKRFVWFAAHSAANWAMQVGCDVDVVKSFKESTGIESSAEFEFLRTGDEQALNWRSRTCGASYREEAKEKLRKLTQDILAVAKKRKAPEAEEKK